MWLELLVRDSVSIVQGQPKEIHRSEREYTRCLKEMIQMKTSNKYE